MKRKVIAGIFVASLFLILFAAIFISAADDQQTQINKAYLCLENKVNKTTCNFLGNEEKFFTYLTIGKCLNEILSASAGNTTCWPKPASSCSVKPTAQGILVLSNANGEDSANAESWLLSHNATATDLVWLLQLESSDAMTCHVKIGGVTTDVSVGKDKSLSSLVNSNCFSLFGKSQNYGNNYWLKVGQDCYNKEIEISCDKDFLTTLLYKKDESTQTPIYVSDAPHSGSSGQSTKETVNSYCFSTSGNCGAIEYEGSLWAAMVLKMKGYDVSAYMPFLITGADDSLNSNYLPNSFLYYITNHADYKSELMKEQLPDGSWDGFNGKYYSTSVAMLPFTSDESLTEKGLAQSWLLKAQGTTGENAGCWNSGNTRDTAFILYSIWGNFGYNGGKCSQDSECKTGEICSNGGCVLKSEECTTDEGCSSGEICSEGICISDVNSECTEEKGGYCMSQTACSVSEGEEIEGLHCSSILETCCNKPKVSHTCSELGGHICQTGETCHGNFMDSSDSGCCDKACTPAVSSENTCTLNQGTCRDSCLSGEQDVTQTYPCTSIVESCCKTKSGGSLWWLWVLIILIVLVILGLVFKNKLRELLIRMKMGKKSGGTGSSSLPPRGFPPGRPGQPMRRGEDMNDVLRKLREMGK